MKFNRLIFCAFLLFGFSVYYAHAQEALLTSGGSFTGIGGSVAFSVGQLVFMSHKSEAGIVSEGVQQTWLITDITQNLDKFKTQVSCNVYPNPVADFLTLKLEGTTLSENLRFEYRLFDITGNLLLQKEITGSEVIIDMGKLVSATYFLKVISKPAQGSYAESVFKIIKQ